MCYFTLYVISVLSVWIRQSQPWEYVIHTAWNFETFSESFNSYRRNVLFHTVCNFDTVSVNQAIPTVGKCYSHWMKFWNLQCESTISGGYLGFQRRKSWSDSTDISKQLHLSDCMHSVETRFSHCNPRVGDRSRSHGRKTGWETAFSYRRNRHFHNRWNQVTHSYGRDYSIHTAWNLRTFSVDQAIPTVGMCYSHCMKF